MSVLINWHNHLVLTDIPVHLQVNLATGSFVEEQQEGESKCNSGQGPHPPVAVGTRLRRLTGISGLIHLREETQSFT